MIVINFYAGPGAGKSTTAAYLFARLKNKGFKVEMSREVAKDLIYEGREVQLGRNQLLVTALQYAKLKDLEAHGCEIAISDSPLPLAIAYGKTMPYSAELETLIYKLNDEFTNLNVWVSRTKPYQQFGRLQDEAGAKALDAAIFNLGHPYDYNCTGDPEGQAELADWIIEDLPSEVAQLAEQTALTRPVEGSTPSLASILEG